MILILCLCYHPFIESQQTLDEKFFSYFKDEGVCNDVVINWAIIQFPLSSFYPARVSFSGDASLVDILCFPGVLAWSAISECGAKLGEERRDAYGRANLLVRDRLFKSKYDYR